MKNSIKSLLKFIIPLLFWCLAWHLGSIAIGNDYLFPGIKVTFNALFAILSDKAAYMSILLTALRVIIGLVLGCFLGISLGILCNHFSLINIILSPLFTIIKSTPVASFIVVLWVILSGDELAVFIGVIMVTPIIWQNILDGYNSVDKQLVEVAQIYNFSPMKKFKLLTFPALKKYLAPAIITSCGLCWKAEIAAEIIAYTKKSIGHSINDAKYYLDTPTVFAWTIIIIVLSIILEKSTKKLLRRYVDNA